MTGKYPQSGDVSISLQTALLDVEQNILTFEHTVHEATFFSDSALARLIDAHPRDGIHIHNRSGSSENPRHLNVALGELSGEDARAGIRRGRLWMSLVPSLRLDPSDVRGYVELVHD